MAFPLYFVYMVDAAMEGMRPVENPVKKYFKQEVFDEMNDLGGYFLRKKLNNLGDWKISQKIILEKRC